MNRLQRFLRSFGAAGAEANARRSCEELRRRDRDVAEIVRRFESRPAAAAVRQVA